MVGGVTAAQRECERRPLTTVLVSVLAKERMGMMQSLLRLLKKVAMGGRKLLVMDRESRACFAGGSAGSEE